MTEYLPRSFWANASWSRGGAALVATDLHRLGNVCHYPGRAAAFGQLSLDALRSAIRGWYTWHVNGRGWSDIGYQTAIDQRGRVVDLRGIGRVPAAHASSSNPRANWHGGATLLIIGNSEKPSAAMIEAYRHYRTTVWLKRWPTATGVTHHRRVPGTATSCAGDHVNQLVNSGTLRSSPSSSGGSKMSIWDESLSVPDWIRSGWPDSFTGGTGRSRTFLVSGYGHSRRASDRALTAANRTKAILANQEGLKAAVSDLAKAVASNAGIDPAPFAALVREHAEAGAVAALEQVALAEQVEALQAGQAAILAAVAAVDRGEVTAAEALRQLAVLITRELDPEADDSEE